MLSHPNANGSLTNLLRIPERLHFYKKLSKLVIFRKQGIYSEIEFEVDPDCYTKVTLIVWFN